MRPVSLKLRNFGSYRGEIEPLDFSDVRLAVLSGPNGAGKSTLIQAIRFALWGATRGNLDSAITEGEEVCKVEFTFGLGLETYLVSRQRSRKGSGSTTLTFQRLVAGAYNEADDVHEGRWESLDGKRGETQERINGILCMTDDLFLASACSDQGDSDRFSSARPGARKEVLSGVLGLEAWERRAKAARAMRAGLQARYDAADGELVRLRAQAAQRRELEAELARLNETAQTLNASLETAVAQLEALNKEHQELLVARQADVTARAELAELQERLPGLREELEAAQSRLSQLRARAALAPALEADIATGQQAEADAKRMEAARVERDRIAQERASLEATIAAEVREHGALMAAAGRNLTEARKAAERERADAIRDLRQKISHAAQVLTTKIAQTRRVHTELQKQAAVLEKAACQRDDLLEVDVPPAQRVALLETCPLIAQAKEAKEKLPVLEAEIRDLEGSDPAAQMRAQLKALETMPVDQAGWEKELAEYDRLRTTAPKSEAGEKLKALPKPPAYDEAAHAAAKAAAAKLPGLLTRREKVKEAQAQVGDAEATATRLASEQEGAQKRAAALEQELGPARDWSAEVALLEEQEEEQEALAAGYRTGLSKCEREQGEASAKLEAAKAAAARAEGLEGEQRELSRRIILLDLLGNARDGAYSKGGIPALLMEQAIPELEGAANEVLEALSEGGMLLELRTQRESGKSLTETLDIVVSDERGPRLYETFSGGERMRVDLALRVGLSMLLAARAGARCELLVLDETAAPLDTQGRQLFVDCLARIADRFATVLCISHCDDILDRFPVRLVVSKTDEGSRVEVLR